MPDLSAGETGAVSDGRSAPFCFQTHSALDVLRDHFQGTKRVTALAVYVALTEAANRRGGASARDGFTATRADIAEAAGVSADTLDRYASDLAKIGLLAIERRRVEGVNLPNIWRLLEPVPVPPLAAPVRPGGGRVGAALKAKKETKGLEKTPGGGAPDPEVDSVLDVEKPPPIRKIDGRNLPLDALAEECGLDPDSPRYRQAVAALNGDVGTVGIKHLFWREAYRWGEENDQLDRLAEVQADPERWANTLERGIHRKAALYRERMPGATLSPTALRDWWLDLEQAPATGNGGLSPAEMANFTEAR